MIAAFIGEKDSLNHSYLVYFVHYRRKREFYAIYVFLCLAAILKKHKEKGKEVLKTKKKKPHQQEKKRKKEKSTKKKFRSAYILLWSCGKLYCCLLELGPERV